MLPVSVWADGLIAHLRLTGDYWQVWVMDEAGKQSKQITDTPVDKVNLSWGPEDRELLYNTNTGETWIMDMKTLKARRVLEDIATMDASWSPDGESIAYGISPEDGVHGFTTLWLSDINGQSRKQIANSLSGDVSGAQWFSDGKKMIFLQCKLGPDFRVHHDFWLSTKEQGTAEQLTNDKQQLKFEHAISQDGRMVYSSAETGYFEVWKLNTEASIPVQLTHFETSAGNPTWSPDGNKIAFDAEQAGLGVFVMNAAGKEVSRLTPKGTLAMRPEWSRSVQATVSRK